MSVTSIDKSLETELLALERRYWQALKDNNADAAVRLSDEPCLVTGAQGVGSLDRATLAKMMAGATYTLDDFEFSEPVVRVLTDDVAVLAYKVHERLTVEGESLSFDAADSSTWVRRGGQWVCAMHTEALAGDPFGRDRVKRAKQNKSSKEQKEQNVRSR